MSKVYVVNWRDRLPYIGFKHRNIFEAIMDDSNDRGEWSSKTESGTSTELKTRESSLFLPKTVAIELLIAQLLNIVEETLDFERDDPKYPVKEVIGSLAILAYGGNSENSLKTIIRHLAYPNDAMHGNTVRYFVKKMNPSDIGEKFLEVNINLIEKSQQLGQLGKDVYASFDVTKLQVLDDPDEIIDAADYFDQINVNVMALTDDDFEAILGAYHLQDKRELSESTRVISMEVLKNLDLEITALFDAGYKAADDARAADLFDKSVINLKKGSKTSGIDETLDDLKDESPAKNPGGYEDLYREMYVIGCSVGDSDEENQLFLINFDASDGQIELTTVKYANRKKIEQLFSDAKYPTNFGSEADIESIKLFYFNMSILFLNIYKIVDQGVYPYIPEDMTITESEILLTIALVVYGRGNIKDHNTVRAISRTSKEFGKND